MLGPIHLKRTIKRTAGCLSVASLPFVKASSGAAACILVYHRVADFDFIDPRRDDWNVTPGKFESQIRALADFGSIVPLMDLPELLQTGQISQRPWVCLTFDDGFANFYRLALPILQRYQAPATFFVPTEVIGSNEPMPFDRWAGDNRHRVSEDAWRAVGWQELEECLENGLVTIGSHSHQHLNGSRCQAQQFENEAGRSREILAARFGAENTQAYAYPYGSRRLGQVPAAYIDAVRAAGYSLAVTTDLGLATAGSDLLALPRVEAHQVDGPAAIRAKASGSLSPYFFTDRLRKSHRR